MRAVIICLFALILSGCAVLSESPTATSPKTRTETLVNIYTNSRELPDKSFRHLGEVTGESCQVSFRDSPPTIASARRQMQITASKMNANAVLLHRCEVTSGMPGCYRQAICIGSALNILEK